MSASTEVSAAPRGRTSGREPKVLLVQPDDARALRLGAELRALIPRVDVVPHAEGVLPGRYALIVADADGLTPEDWERLTESVTPADSQPRLLLFSTARRREDLLPLVAAPRPINWVARTPEDDLSDFRINVQKTLVRDIFGIERYFDGAVTQVTLTLRKSAEKGALHAAVNAFGASLGLSARVTALLETAADELFTNAIYDAPRTQDGNHRNRHRSRRQEIELEDGELVKVSLCGNKRRVGISVMDPFGSLEPQRVQHYLAKCFRGGADQVDDKEGGAGLGLYQVFETLSHLVVNIEPNVRTEVVGLIDLRPTFREIAERPKSFNLFISSGAHP